jgi:hypothetical protein
VKRAPVGELRRLFNEAYLVRVLDGQLAVRNFGEQTLYQNPPTAQEEHREPEGTISGFIEIIDRDTNRRVAVAHRLLRPDGTFGASGWPDPKMVLIDNVVYLQSVKRDAHLKTNGCHHF